MGKYETLMKEDSAASGPAPPKPKARRSGTIVGSLALSAVLTAVLVLAAYVGARIAREPSSSPEPLGAEPTTETASSGAQPEAGLAPWADTEASRLYHKAIDDLFVALTVASARMASLSEIIVSKESIILSYRLRLMSTSRDVDLANGLINLLLYAQQEDDSCKQPEAHVVVDRLFSEFSKVAPFFVSCRSNDRTKIGFCNDSKKVMGCFVELATYCSGVAGQYDECCGRFAGLLK